MRVVRGKKLNRILQTRERQKEALELRAAGLTYREIGERLGMSTNLAVKTVSRALDGITLENAGQVLQVELSRLDEMHEAIWSKALSGEYEAIDRVLKIMERRARYLGIDAPKVVHFDLARASDEQLAQILEGHNPVEVLNIQSERFSLPPAESGGSGEEEEVLEEGSGLREDGPDVVPDD